MQKLIDIIDEIVKDELLEEVDNYEIEVFVNDNPAKIRPRNYLCMDEVFPIDDILESEVDKEGLSYTILDDKVHCSIFNLPYYEHNDETLYLMLTINKDSIKEVN